MANEDDPLAMCKGPSGLIFMLLAVLLVFIMFQPEIGQQLISVVDVVFLPVLGFDFQYPMITLLVTALIMIIFSTVARHFMIDWKEMARNQKMMSSYQAEVKKAQKENNELRLKKLQDMNPEILKLQQKQMMGQMKPMVVTMFVAIILFRWLYYFIDRLPHNTVRLPWIEHFHLTSKAFTKVFETCCFWGSGAAAGGIPYWIGLYILISIPFGQVLMRGLKLWDYNKDLKKLAVNRIEDVNKRLKEADLAVKEASSKGVDVARFKATLDQARSFRDKEEFGKANEFIDKAVDGLKEAAEAHERTMAAIKEVETQNKELTVKGMRSDKIKNLIKDAKAKMKEMEFESAISLVKSAEDEIRKYRKDHGDAEGVISSIKSFLYDYKDCDDSTCENLVREMQDDFKNSRYDDVAHKAKMIKKEARRLEKEFKQTQKLVEKAGNKVKEASGKNLDVRRAEADLDKALRHFEKRQYTDAQDHAQSALDQAQQAMDETRVAEEELSLAKLVVSNAEDFGADVQQAKMALISAERYFEQKLWGQSIQHAREAKDKAEAEKAKARKK